jgi:hypothetical protein
MVDCRAEDALGASVIEEGYGFIPSVCVSFRLDKEAIEAGVITILRVTMAILGRTTGDAVLLFNGEHPVLLRSAGQLLLNNSRGFWTPKLLSEIGVPYEEKAIPSL